MGKRQKYHYPKSVPLFKFIWNAETIRKNPIPFHKKHFNAIGNTFSVRIGWKRYIILTRDAEMIKQILQKQHTNFQKSDIQTRYLSKYLGKGLLTSNGAHWLRQRRLIQPAFHKKKLDGLVVLIQKTIEQELSGILTQQAMDVFPLMNRLAFKVVATSLFDLSISEAQLVRLQYIIEEVQAFLVKELRVPHKKWWYKLSGQMKHHLALAKESRVIIQEIIEDRKASKNTHQDLLEMLLDARYEDSGAPMEMQQLIDEITILFVAGHETTANALSFTYFLLAKHPAIQQKVLEEVTLVERGFPSGVEKIQQLPYTKAVIEEAMRLYPPAWITDRASLKDASVGDYVLQSKTLIGISFYELHRNPEYWKDPDTFWPERFLEREKGTKDAYYPFGAGPRMCIGMGFALYEMILAVAFVVHRYHLSTTLSEAKMNPLITLKPDGLEVTFTER